MNVEQAKARAERVKGFAQHTETEIALVVLADHAVELERRLIEMDEEIGQVQAAAK